MNFVYQMQTMQRKVILDPARERMRYAIVRWSSGEIMGFWCVIYNVVVICSVANSIYSFAFARWWYEENYEKCKIWNLQSHVIYFYWSKFISFWWNIFANFEIICLFVLHSRDECRLIIQLIIINTEISHNRCVDYNFNNSKCHVCLTRILSKVNCKHIGQQTKWKSHW